MRTRRRKGKRKRIRKRSRREMRGKKKHGRRGNRKLAAFSEAANFSDLMYSAIVSVTCRRNSSIRCM